MHLQPREFGFEICDLESLKVWDATQAKDMLLGVLDNLHGPARNIVLLNAGAAIYVAGCAASLAEGIAKATRSDRKRCGSRKIAPAG